MDRKNEEGLFVHGLTELTITSKAIYKFNVIPITIPIVCLKEIKEALLKFVLTHKRTQRVKEIIRKMKRFSQHIP